MQGKEKRTAPFECPVSDLTVSARPRALDVGRRAELPERERVALFVRHPLYATPGIGVRFSWEPDPVLEVGYCLSTPNAPTIWPSRPYVEWNVPVATCGTPPSSLS